MKLKPVKICDVVLFLHSESSSKIAFQFKNIKINKQDNCEANLFKDLTDLQSKRRELFFNLIGKQLSYFAVRVKHMEAILTSNCDDN